MLVFLCLSFAATRPFTAAIHRQSLPFIVVLLLRSQEIIEDSALQEWTMRRERVKAKSKLLADYAEYKRTWRAVTDEIKKEDEQFAKEEKERREAEAKVAVKLAEEQAKKAALQQARDEAAAIKLELDRPTREVKPSTLLTDEDFVTG